MLINKMSTYREFLSENMKRLMAKGLAFGEASKECSRLWAEQKLGYATGFMFNSPVTGAASGGAATGESKKCTPAFERKCKKLDPNSTCKQNATRRSCVSKPPTSPVASPAKSPAKSPSKASKKCTKEFTAKCKARNPNSTCKRNATRRSCTTTAQ